MEEQNSPDTGCPGCWGGFGNSCLTGILARRWDRPAGIGFTGGDRPLLPAGPSVRFGRAPLRGRIAGGKAFIQRFIAAFIFVLLGRGGLLFRLGGRIFVHFQYSLPDGAGPARHEGAAVVL
ncbi:hypothetical protein AA16663_1782 [Komagataeibacter rhaeticus DSM 16663]|nr:hypothetical protein AA16663_1782 [Komagataeibacter rhaeticus DSM 16663]